MYVVLPWYTLFWSYTGFVSIHALLRGAKINPKILSLEQKLQISCTRSRGGGPNHDSQMFKWILLWCQYIRPGKKDFLNLVTVLNLHIDHQHFENHYVRVKNQSCRKLYIWVSKPIRRKIQNQWKKLELNRTYQSREKSQKPPEWTWFQKTGSFGWFSGFFSWLVSPIEL